MLKGKEAEQFIEKANKAYKNRGSVDFSKEVETMHKILNKTKMKVEKTTRVTSVVITGDTDRNRIEASFDENNSIESIYTYGLANLLLIGDEADANEILEASDAEIEIAFEFVKELRKVYRKQYDS